MSTTPVIKVPKVKKQDPDTGLHKTILKGVRRYRAWWWQDEVVTSKLLKARTIEEARVERDAVHAALVAGGARARTKGNAARVRRLRNRKPRIQIRVVLGHKVLGKFDTLAEAEHVRDHYLADQAKLRQQLRELKRFRML